MSEAITVERNAADLPPTSQLCVSCGMCCDGTLFSQALLKAGEPDEARRLGMQVFTIGSGPPETVVGYDDAFRLPCHLHDRGWCTIYDDTARPHVCGAFQCVLLKRLVAGEVDLDRSLEAARIGRDLADQVKGRVGSATAEPGSLWAQVADVWRVEGNNVISRLRALGVSDDTLMDVVALRAHLLRHFLAPPTGAAGGDEPATAESEAKALPDDGR